MLNEIPVRKIDCSLLSLLEGDCVNELTKIPSSSVDLVFTSPPYAEQRQDKYNSVSTDKYVEWFKKIGLEIKRILKPSVSFFLNIAAHCEDGERHIYVMELIIALKKEVGLKYIDELVWYKSANPRRWDFRLKNAWEPIFHFAIDRPYINHDNALIRTDSAFLNKRGISTYNQLTGNVGGHHEICDQGAGWTIADNVLYFPTALLVKDKFQHPAKFPLEMAEFFIKTYCPPDGIVCDPFMGSGITALASLRYNRKCIGIEMNKDFIEMTMQRIAADKPVKKKILAETEGLDMFDAAS
jgi:DNA modification methylase